MENNGQWKVKVDVFRGYVKGKIEDISKMNGEQKNDIADIKKYLGELKNAFIVRPQNCPINTDVKDLDKKIDSVEKYVFGQRAVQKFKMAFWGMFSGLLGTIVALLTYVLLIAKNT